MKRPIRWLVNAVVLFVAIVAFVVVVGLGYREWRHANAEPLYEIASPEGIDEARYVEIDGISHWITIRGHDRTRPIVLFLHGGPGSPMGGFARNFFEWEQEYVVVHWDQPGAGRTFGAAGNQVDPDLTVERMAADGNQLAQWLSDYLGSDQVIALGWSWGSALGAYMVKARPDLYSVFVTTGQFVNAEQGEELGYTSVVAKAQQRGDTQALADLETIGPPPYDSNQEIMVQRAIAMDYEFGQSFIDLMLPTLWEPRVTLGDIFRSFSGANASVIHFFGESFDGPLMDLDLRDLGPDFELPVYVIQGLEDDFTPASLAETWLDFIRAPDKAYFPIEGAGHFALFSQDQQFREVLRNVIERSRP